LPAGELGTGKQSSRTHGSEVRRVRHQAQERS
jgi:hypothetical protein